jgi:hypothetical protein
MCYYLQVWRYDCKHVLLPLGSTYVLLLLLLIKLSVCIGAQSAIFTNRKHNISSGHSWKGRAYVRISVGL